MGLDLMMLGDTEMTIPWTSLCFPYIDGIGFGKNVIMTSKRGAVDEVLLMNNQKCGKLTSCGW